MTARQPPHRLYAVGSLSSSASAGEEDGLIQTDVTIVAVTVDETASSLTA